jgi:uncharacterized protein
MKLNTARPESDAPTSGPLRPMTRLLQTALVALLLVACGTDPDGAASLSEGAAGMAEEGPRPPRGEAWVIFGSDTVRAEVAATARERERGLMGRTELPDGTGMLFVFEAQETRRFWMRNTVIPLDIGFLDQRQVLVDVQQMEPLDEEFTESRAPAMFALEVPQGWFEAKGIEPGTQARVIFGRR